VIACQIIIATNSPSKYVPLITNQVLAARWVYETISGQKNTAYERHQAETNGRSIAVALVKRGQDMLFLSRSGSETLKPECKS
jgi:hypothetical protein